jgi:NADH:ubiquinone oxidoreductase subunit B-like Fe-S oxidoreductase
MYKKILQIMYKKIKIINDDKNKHYLMTKTNKKITFIKAHRIWKLNFGLGPWK